MDTTLPSASMVLAVCAHPDDESFGLGAVVSAYTAAGIPVALLCFTAGEASTLGNGTEDLPIVRARELAAAGAVLGILHTELLTYPDGGLATIPLGDLAAHVSRHIDHFAADLLLVFDEGGVTGHRDHCVATAAALAAAEARPTRVLAWTAPMKVADALNSEFGTHFAGRVDGELDAEIEVDRARQRRAIACHVSQATHNPVLWRRLELLGGREWLRFLSAHALKDTPSCARRPAVGTVGAGRSTG
jgi:N-acetylglucosamine malate deacetylase 2